ncbi:NF038122 family metalloprotease [Oscillatoriales cyanobacterium LEGE 11467]|uniref:NF038122 family metalloprotease n=1 Tax=Zarconia navalis LEGE 11467 TaxID=1828826 RepID=A0A928VW29_9CYAN|nr:NF038122 family metalloprotease [Zarconia navalis]MBE9041307.1 NF038122 family metalloprotease [Zarconia navalis LEGE 11467]
MNTKVTTSLDRDNPKLEQLSANVPRSPLQAKESLCHKYRNRMAQLMKTAPKLAIALAALLSKPAPVEAASFNFTYAPGATLEQMLGFEVAANVWSNFLVDDVEVNLFVDIVDSSLLPANVVGGSLPGVNPGYDYGEFRNELYADRTSNNDWTAYSNLNLYTYQSGANDPYADRYRVAFERGNSYWYNKNLTLTNANAKALGLRPTHDNAMDGYIVMSDLSDHLLVDWDYNYRRDSSAPWFSLDYASVAIHEIGHALGFISGIDSALVREASGTFEQNLDRLFRTTSLDLFRYSKWSKNKGWLDLAVGPKSYLSIDGGRTALADFSRGNKNFGLGSDGFQGSHWKQQGNEIGIMDPLIFLGERPEVQAPDLQAFDIMGWDLRSDLRDGISSSELNLNWFDLTSQAEQRLANSLGISVADLFANSTTWANSLTSWVDTDNDSVDDRVEQMLENSEVYNWCWILCGGSGGGSWQSGLWQEFRWQTLPTEAIQANAQSVPEPTSTTGFLALGVLGIGSRLKRRSQPL